MGRTGAVVDGGHPDRGIAASASVCLRCQNDDEVVEGVRSAVVGDEDGRDIPAGGVDFVWARLRELEFAKGWRDQPPDAAGDNGEAKVRLLSMEKARNSIFSRS